jgi:hypothetical protein
MEMISRSRSSMRAATSGSESGEKYLATSARTGLDPSAWAVFRSGTSGTDGTPCIFLI